MSSPARVRARFDPDELIERIAQRSAEITIEKLRLLGAAGGSIAAGKPASDGDTAWPTERETMSTDRTNTETAGESSSGPPTVDDLVSRLLTKAKPPRSRTQRARSSKGSK